MKPFISALLKHILKILPTSLVRLLPASADNKVNLKVIFSTEELIRQELKQDFLLDNKQHLGDLSRNSVCLARFSTYPDSSIKQAIVIIPVDRA